ncbi:glycoside hydrolase family 26 protein [uncultured Shewanella sp.]|uniref:glycoside hydrolase family 26 protein n=1 Tax=uncultured Shewanella sp. TaxID=173975 RepID=UPI00260BC206|nr:glycosyl hydrolase [uncultured Shewanella sp.]
MRNVIYVILLTLLSIKSNLAMSDQVMLGAYLYEDAYEESVFEDVYADLEVDNLSIINIFINFDYDWDELDTQCSAIVEQGAVCMITFEPDTSDNTDEDNLLSEITAGEWDSYFNQWIRDFRSWLREQTDENKKILFRFAHEFNGNWYTWSGEPGAYRAAWQYLHDKFEGAYIGGVSINEYIEWVWCANNTSSDDINNIRRYYPGDDYVDWLALDGYNWGDNYSYSSWLTFEEVFSDQYNVLVENYPDKPILLTEVASAEPTDTPDTDPYNSDPYEGDETDIDESKAHWIENMFDQISHTYTAIKGVVWFNMNKELNWSLNQDFNAYTKSDDSLIVIGNNTGLEAAVESAKESYVTTDYYSAASYDMGSNDELSQQWSVNENTSKHPKVPSVGSEKRQKHAEGLKAMSSSDISALRQRRFDWMAEIHTRQTDSPTSIDTPTATPSSTSSSSASGSVSLGWLLLLFVSIWIRGSYCKK